MYYEKMRLTGYTLVEMVISIFLILLILVILLCTVQIGQNTYHTLFQTTSSEDNLRYISVKLETQILHSDVIYVVNDIIYCRDMETSDYFNYYYCHNNMLYKVKTTEKLNSIGLGSTSQYAEDIIKYQVTYNRDNFVHIYIEGRDKEKAYSVNREIPYGGKVVIIK